MSRLFYHVMQDNAGNLLFDVTGTMRLAGTGTLATIYGDESLSVVLPNPMTNHPSFASFKCFLGAGDYDFYMGKAGYTFETLTGVQGHGTMAQQDASAVAITGGTAVLASELVHGTVQCQRVLVANTTGNDQAALQGLMETAGGTNRWNLQLTGTAPNFMQGALGLGGAPTANAKECIFFDKSGAHGLAFFQQVADAGGNPVLFHNTGGTVIGTISSTGSAVAYNTTSDARLKHAVAPMVEALQLLALLRPVTFRWKADDTSGCGFLAHELQQVLPSAVTGEPDALTADGQVLPQGVDHSKLVPWLTAAVQELSAQVQALTARLSDLEGAVLA